MKTLATIVAALALAGCGSGSSGLPSQASIAAMTDCAELNTLVERAVDEYGPYANKINAGQGDEADIELTAEWLTVAVSADVRRDMLGCQ